jgi:hypothetical protein
LVHDEANLSARKCAIPRRSPRLERRKAYVKQVKVDYYTDAQMKSDLKILDISEDQIIQDQLFAMARCGHQFGHHV